MSTENHGVGQKTINLGGLRLDARATVIVVVSTLLLTIDYYSHFLPATGFAQALEAKALERTVYYLVIPLLIIIVSFRDSPRDYGMQFGDWRAGLKWTAIIVLIGLPVLYLAARTPSMQAYYGGIPRTVPQILGTSALDLFGWEFFFRGFILFGLYRIAGPNAILIQAVPFALAHLGKPEVETITTVFGGILFGWVAWKTRSFVYPFLIHWAINVFVIFAAMGMLAGWLPA